MDVWGRRIPPKLKQARNVNSAGEPYLEAFEELFSEEEPPTTSSQAFIVRIWSETTDEGGHASTWRGSIQTVGSNRRLYFYDFNAIRRFIEESLQLTSGPPRSWWQSLLHKLHLNE